MATPKGYTTVDAVAGYLGQTMTADQESQAYSLMAACENFIDAETQGNGGWLNGPIVAEQYNAFNQGHEFFLRSVPVTSVESIYKRKAKVGDTPILLTANTDYEVLDLKQGKILLSQTTMVYGSLGYGYGYGYGDPAWSPEWGNIGGIALGAGVLLLVSYTPVQAVPATISQCATEIVAFWMNNNIHPERYGLTSLASADIKETYSQMLIAGCFPANIDRYFENFQTVSF